MDHNNRIAFTVDVEDGISIAMRDAFNTRIDQTERVVILTRKILKLLQLYDAKGTFFVLGQVAEKFPFLIREISQHGHELGVHGYDHLQFFRMNRKKAFEEISRAKKLIEDISGDRVIGHRAPAFSIMPETEWGLDVIAECGFLYDSSIMPAKTARYGWKDFGKSIQKINTPSGMELIEVPMSTVSLFNLDLPVGGGGYLRLLPYYFTQKALSYIINKRPAVVYIHPYDLDSERYPEYYIYELNKTDYLKRLKLKSMWWNRSNVFKKLEKIVEHFEVDTMKSIVERELKIED